MTPETLDQTIERLAEAEWPLVWAQGTELNLPYRNGYKCGLRDAMTSSDLIPHIKPQDLLKHEAVRELCAEAANVLHLISRIPSIQWSLSSDPERFKAATQKLEESVLRISQPFQAKE